MIKKPNNKLLNYGSGENIIHGFKSFLKVIIPMDTI